MVATIAQGVALDAPQLTASTRANPLVCPNCGGTLGYQSGGGVLIHGSNSKGLAQRVIWLECQRLTALGTRCRGRWEPGGGR